MHEYNRLLERMVSISPGARLYLTGQLYQEHIDEDEVTARSLVTLCFSILIDEAYELGLEFFCTRADLCENFYHLDKVLLVFEVIFPTPLYRSITEDDSFKRQLVALVRDGAGDANYPTVMNLLDYLGNDHPTARDVFYDSYVFLQDKLVSTPVFDRYVQSMLDADTLPFEPVVDEQAMLQYCEHVRCRVARLLKAIDGIHQRLPKLHATIQLQYNRLDWYKANAVDPATLSQHVWAYQRTYVETTPASPIEQALLARIDRAFDSITPFYLEYFQVRGIPLQFDDLVSLVLGCFDGCTTQDAFAAQCDITLARLGPTLLPDPLQYHVLIQQLCLCLGQEFTG